MWTLLRTTGISGAHSRHAGERSDNDASRRSESKARVNTAKGEGNRMRRGVAQIFDPWSRCSREGA